MFNIDKGSFDFLGFNHYSCELITTVENVPKEGQRIQWYRQLTTGTWESDQETGRFWNPNIPSGSVPIFKITPRAIRSALNWIKDHYDNPIVIITECGICMSNRDKTENPLEDTMRVNFYKDYIAETYKAISEDGCNVQGFMAWCLLDGMEWTGGFE